MIYIYEKDGAVLAQRDVRPDADDVIEIERMPLRQVIPGYTPVLWADFRTGAVDYIQVPAPPTPDEAREELLARIAAYDNSEAVNSFTINGLSGWLDSKERVNLKARFESMITVQSTQPAHLLFGGIQIPVPLEAAPLFLHLLAGVEVYAGLCFDCTAGHMAAALALDTLEAIEKYDYTRGYPEKPAINLPMP